MACVLLTPSLVQLYHVRPTSVPSQATKSRSNLLKMECSLKRYLSNLSKMGFSNILNEFRICGPRRFRKKSIVTVNLNDSLIFTYHLTSSHFYLQRRGFRTEHSQNTTKSKKSFWSSLFGIVNSTREGSRHKGMQVKAFQEKLKVIPENEKKGFLEGYMTALDYSNEQKNKRSTLRAVFTSVALLTVGIYFIIKSFGLPQSTFFSSVEEVDPENIGVTFKHVQGVDEAKLELSEIVSYLRDPGRYIKLGARLPKGVLLVGPPGTGKTLLARAIAGEAQVPFFQASGSEFDELFVGQGARRIRDLFARAKEKAPCIVFIDEIDSVGSKRVTDAIHPHANQTVNQLLSEMDGFNPNEGVIVIGATNRVEDLDSALLRPGRFDVRVQVPYPDYEGRKDIIRLYMDRIDHDSDVDIDILARETTGFTGADIENMINQAALRAAADSYLTVTMHYLEEARDRVMMGPARLRGRLPDEEANRITAYHEAGHTLVSMFTNDAVPFHKVTIIPRGNSLGHTAMMPEKDEYHVNKSQMLAQIDTLMGGRVSEELIFGVEKVTTGAADDLKKATDLATKMVKTFGMSDRVGLRISDEESKAFFNVNQLSPPASEIVDKEISRILKESYERAKELLTKHKKKHVMLAEALLEYETLSAEEVNELLTNGKISRNTSKPEKLKIIRPSFVLAPHVVISPIEKSVVIDEASITNIDNKNIN